MKTYEVSCLLTRHLTLVRDVTLEILAEDKEDAERKANEVASAICSETPDREWETESDFDVDVREIQELKDEESDDPSQD